MALTPDGKTLASSGTESEAYGILLRDPATGKQLAVLKGHTNKPAHCMGFSPDGKTLVSATHSDDHAIILWDVASGKDVATITNKDFVNTLAFSPDGQTLASAQDSGGIQLWDVATGKEQTTLKGHNDFVSSVSFSPDGRRLASAGSDNTMRVWETEQVSAGDLQRREIVDLVRDRFDRLLLRSEVLAQLLKVPTLDSSTRDATLAVAQTTPDDPERLNTPAWLAVKARGAGHGACALALQQAEAAVQAAPGNGDYLTTLGVAHYRLGAYAKALATLEQSEKLNATQIGTQPADLAFLAMAHHQLGHKEQAQALLGRLRELMQRTRWEKNAEAQGFPREAKELIDGKPADKQE